MSFFEGSEKKIEVTLKEGEKSLRDLGRDYFSNIVKSCKADILSVVKNDFVDAYLLSESSLFVYDNRFIMITCGQTVMINSFLEFLKTFKKEKIASLIFQRKNEYISYLQKTSFYEDLETLQKHLNGKAYRFGDLDGHHNFLYHLDSPFKPESNDTTTELLMYHIEGDAAKIFQKENGTLSEIRDLLKLENIFLGFKFDDFLFTPYGYSLNGIKDELYLTIHVTPQSNNSYVSFETNIYEQNQLKEILSHIVSTFKPYTFDVISFNAKANLDSFGDDYQEISSTRELLSCGYVVNFRQLSKSGTKTKSAELLN